MNSPTTRYAWQRMWEEETAILAIGGRGARGWRKDRALELWEKKLRRDPGIGGMRDRRPPWVRQQDEEMQHAMHDEDFYFVQPTMPGVPGWTKGRRRREWVQRALPDNCYWVTPAQPGVDGHWGRRMSTARGNVGAPPDDERDAYEARRAAELSEARYRHQPPAWGGKGCVRSAQRSGTQRGVPAITTTTGLRLRNRRPRLSRGARRRRPGCAAMRPLRRGGGNRARRRGAGARAAGPS